MDYIEFEMVSCTFSVCIMRCKRIIAKLLIVVVLAFFLRYCLQLLKKQHALFVYAEKKLFSFIE